MKNINVIRILMLSFALLSANAASAQSTEQKFNDLFVTAGYCTAYGAAIGTALLSFKEDPSENLKFVAVGASLGFIGGSILSSYLIFSPGLVQNDDEGTGSTLVATNSIPAKGVAIRPYWNKDKKSFSGIEAGATLLSW